MAELEPGHDTPTIISKLRIGNKEYQFNATKVGLLLAEDVASKQDIKDGLTTLVGALVYKGSLLTEAGQAGYTPSATKGDVYVVAFAGTVNGIKCESGDMWVCHEATDAGTSTNTARVNQNWDVIQANIDVAQFAKSNHKHSVTAKGTVGSREITPAGTISQPTFTGTAAEHTHTVSTHEGHTFEGTPVQLVGEFAGDKATVSGNYTPAGSITDISITPAGSVTVTTAAPGSGETPDFYSATGTTGGAGKHSHTGSVSSSYTPAGDIVIEKATSGTANYTPGGTISEVSGHTHTVGVSIDYTPAGTISTDGAHTHTVSASGKFTPAGSITTLTSGGTGHTHSITKDTAQAIKKVSGELTGTIVNGDTLELAHVITADPVTVVTSVSATTGSTALGFSGTQGNVSVTGTAASAGSHDHTFTGTKATLTQTATAASAGGHKHTFSGTGVRLVGTFTGTAATISGNFTTSEAENHTHSFTGAGKMFSATFTGTAASHKHTFNGTQKAIGGEVTPTGSVTIRIGNGPTNFTPAGTVSGTAKTITTSATSITPEGTVSKPTFTGTPASHDHNFTGTAVDSGTEK